MAATNKGELRKKREEEEKKAAEVAKSATEEQSPAQVKGPSAPVIEKTDKGVTAHIGPTNRPFTQDQSFKLNQRKAVRETPYEIVETGKIGQLPEVLEPHREMLQRKNDVGDLMASSAHPWAQNKIKVDPTKITSETQLFYFGSTLADKASVEALYKDYAKRNGLKVDDLYYRAETALGANAFYNQGPKSRYGRLNRIGLYNPDGTTLDPATANPAQFAQSIRRIPPGKDHDEAEKIYVSMYGKVEDGYLDFVDSAYLTATEYNAAVKKMNSSFTISQGATQENIDAYLENVDDILMDYEDPVTQKYMLSALKNSYELHTGVEAPSEEELRKMLEAEQEKKPDGNGKNPDILGRIAGGFAAAGEFLSSAFTGKREVPKPDEVTEYGAAGQEEESMEAASASSGGSGGGGYVAPASSYAAAGDSAILRRIAGTDDAQTAAAQAIAGQTASEHTLETQGPVQQKQEEASEEEQSPEQTLEQYGNRIEYNPEMTDEEALALHSSGAVLDDRNYEQIKWFVENRNARGLINGITGSMYGDLGRDEQGRRNVINTFDYYGNSLAAAAMSSANLPDDMANLSALELGRIVSEIDSIVADPENAITVPKGQNMYEYVLSLPQYEELAARVEKVSGALALVNEAQAEQAQKEKEARARLLESDKAQILAGNGTPEMAQRVADAYANDYVDTSDDELLAIYRAQMRETGTFYSDGGTFWNGWSAAAVEGANMRKLGSGYGLFKSGLKDKTLRVLDEYASAAAKLGMDLEGYLGNAGIDSLDQVIDIAYNEMLTEGKLYAKDEEAQQAATQLATTSIGMAGALATGARQGAESYASDFMQTTYMAVSALDYEQNKLSIQDKYNEQYGPRMAAAMYYADLMAYIDSGALSEESANDLLDHMKKARSIFDVAYEIDASFLTGLVRTGREELQKDVEELGDVIAKLPPDERAAANFASGVTYSLPGMAVATIAGGATGSALIGSAVAWGMPEYSSAYDENRAAGMSPSMAAWAAMGNGIISTLVNMGGTGTQMELLWGDAPYAAFRDALGSKGGRGLMKEMAKYLGQRGIEEGTEELVEFGLGTAFDLLDKEFIDIEKTGKLSLSRTLDNFVGGLAGADYAELAKEAMQNFGAGFVMGGLFSVVGAAKTAYSAVKGARMQGNYASVNLAVQMADGNAPFTEENIGKVISSLQTDLKDPRFRRWLDSRSAAARDQNATLTAMMLGEGSDARKNAVESAKKARAYEEKAKAAKEASDSAKSRYFEVRERVLNGEIEADVELENALDQWGKAETALQDATGARDKALENAKQQAKEWLRACRESAVTVKADELEQHAQRIANERYEIARLLDALYTQMEKRDKDMSREVAYAEDFVFAEEPYEIDETQAEVSDMSAEIAVDNVISLQNQIDEAETADEQVEATASMSGAISQVKRVLGGMVELAYDAYNKLGNMELYDQIVERYNNAVAKLRDAGIELDERELPRAQKGAEVDVKALLEEMNQAGEAYEAQKSEERAAQEAEAEREARKQEEVDYAESAVFYEQETETPETETDEGIYAIDSAVEEAVSLQEQIRDAEHADTQVAASGALRTSMSRIMEMLGKLLDRAYEAYHAIGNTDAYNSLADRYNGAVRRLREAGIEVQARELPMSEEINQGSRVLESEYGKRARQKKAELTERRKNEEKQKKAEDRRRKLEERKAKSEEARAAKSVASASQNTQTTEPADPTNVEAYIEQRHPNATEEEKQNLREMYDEIVRRHSPETPQMTLTQEESEALDAAYSRLEEAKRAKLEKAAAEEKRRARIHDIATGTTAQQREEARVRKQEAANSLGMDAQAYIEQNHQDASEEDKAKLRELYGRIAGEKSAAAQDKPVSVSAQDGMDGQGAQENTGSAATSTDLLHIMDGETAYGRLSDEKQAGRRGDILMGRIAEDDGNMTPATRFEAAQQREKKNKKLERSAMDAIRELARELKIGLRTRSGMHFQTAGSYQHEGVAGYYIRGQRNAILRPTHAGEVSVAAHEIGHGLQEQLGLPSNQQMIESWKYTFGNSDAYSPEEYNFEAFAEFFWRYLCDRDWGVEYAGSDFVDSFEMAMRRQKIDGAVAKAQRAVNAYMNADMMDRIGSNIVNAADVKTKSDTPIARRIEIAMADDTAAAEDVGDIIRNITGEKHLPLEQNLRSIILFNRKSAARANECLTTAMVDKNGNVVGESLKDVFSGLNGKEDFDLFWEYMVLKHSMDRDTAKEAKNQVLAESEFSTEERRKKAKQIEQEHPEFVSTNKRFQKWRRLFLETYLADNGFLGTQEEAVAFLDTLDATYPNYVPTRRVKDGKEEQSSGGRSFEIMTATGSTEAIIHPFDSFVGMVNSITAMVADNENKKAFAQMFDAFRGVRDGQTGAGFGLLAAEHIPDIERVSVPIDGMRYRVQNLLREIGTDPDAILKVGEIIGDEAVTYRGTGKVDMDNVITVRMEDGRKRYFEIYNPELFALLSSTGTTGSSELLHTASVLTRTMSMLTTGSNPVFALTNAMRDFQNSVNYGSWATSYLDGSVKWLGALADVIRHGKATKEYEAMGGGGWQMFDTATKKGSEQIRGEVFKGYNKSSAGRRAKAAGRKLFSIATMEKINEVIEKTSRLAEYKYGKHDRSTTSGRIEAFLAAQDVTVDFSRHGNSSLTRDLKTLVPFFNASMQGIYRTARQVTAQESERAMPRFAKTVLNGVLASALANGLLLKYMDDDEKEEYANMSGDLKAKHMFLPNFAPDIFGNAPLIRIPLDQNPVMYAINGAVSNFIWYGQTDNELVVEASALADVILDNLNPVSGTILDPLIATQTNKNWYGRNIVPTYLQSYDETNQYTEETPTPFIAASSAMSKVGINISPMMLQYMAQQYTGYIGQTIIPALPSEKNKDNLLSGILNSLVATARKRMTSDPLVSNGVVSQVYDSYNTLNEVYKAGTSKRNFVVPHISESLSDRERRRAINEADDLIHSGGDVYEAKKEISALYDKIDKINARDDLTDDEKYALTSRTRRKIINYALDANEAVNDYMTRYGDSGIVKRMIDMIFGTGYDE